MDSGVQGAPVQVAGQGLLRDGAGGARHRSVRRLHHRRADTPGTTTEAAGYSHGLDRRLASSLIVGED
jgi:hypothetical protein